MKFFQAVALSFLALASAQAGGGNVNLEVLEMGNGLTLQAKQGDWHFRSVAPGDLEALQAVKSHGTAQPAINEALIKRHTDRQLAHNPYHALVVSRLEGAVEGAVFLGHLGRTGYDLKDHIEILNTFREIGAVGPDCMPIEGKGFVHMLSYLPTSMEESDQAEILDGAFSIATQLAEKGYRNGPQVDELPGMMTVHLDPKNEQEVNILKDMGFETYEGLPWFNDRQRLFLVKPLQ